jgi:hypothetical protein
MDPIAYRNSPAEKARIADLLEILPKGHATALDIGARDGYISRLLAEHFQNVTALDLELPTFQFDRVTPVQGDVTALQFPERAFDVVVCSEVLEHLPPELLPRACSEIVRVARHAVFIGVPYKQDLRVGRMTCLSCGRVNPSWGHLNSFDEARLHKLFQPLKPIKASHVGQGDYPTTALAAFLSDLAGNPWGTYNQEEPCIHCGRQLVRPTNRNLFQRLCGAAAHYMGPVEELFFKRQAMWIHIVFSRT